MYINNITAGNDTATEMQILKNKYNLTEQELCVLFDIESTNISDGKIVSKQKLMSLDTETAAISLLNTISNDARLTAYIDELYARYHLNNSILSKISGIEEHIINDLYNNPELIPFEIKYSLCIKVVYLLFLFSNR